MQIRKHLFINRPVFCKKYLLSDNFILSCKKMKNRIFIISS